MSAKKKLLGASIMAVVLAVAGGGSIRSLSHDADVNHQVMILVFGDKWQEEVSRFASR